MGIKQIQFHAPPALCKMKDGKYVIVGIQPVEPYSEERFQELKDEYHRRDEEHKKLRQTLTSKTYSIPSKSDPSKTYTVTHHTTGEWECECPGYMFRRKCNHIDKAKEMEGE